MIRTAVGLSFAPAVDPRLRRDLAQRATVALSVRDRLEVHRVIDDPALAVLVTGDVPESAQRTSLALDARPRHDRDEVQPPGASICIGEGQARFLTDAVGLKHLYITSGAGWSAAGTSALVLGAVVGADLDADAIGALALLGFLTGQRTLLAGVERVAAGHDLLLELGRGTPVPHRRSTGTATAAGGPTVVAAAVRRGLEADPMLGLELSGGLDSRVLLAAIPPEERRGRVAMTIGHPGDADVTIASRIAARYGLDHHVLEPLREVPTDPDVALAAAMDAGRARDHAADALAGQVLDDVERRAPAGARLTGVNGEFVRGFYYAGTARTGAVTRQRVERLARWRLFANHRTADWLLQPGQLEVHARSLIDEMAARMAPLGATWRTATDEYYLADRIPNWAGPGYSHGATRRPVVAPFLDPAFLAWARRTPVADRAGSRALAVTLAALDPTLATLPLVGGPRPTELARTGAAADVARGRRFAVKAAGKVHQRLRNQRRPPTGAAMLVTTVTRALSSTEVAHDLRAVPLLSEEGLARLASPSVALDQPTASLLVNVLGVVRYLTDVARRAETDQPPAAPSAPGGVEEVDR
jgi:asparagine synthase (glutamine-hydrolysing)